MINSIGGLGAYDYIKTASSRDLKEEKTSFGQVLDSVTIVNNSGKEEVFGITIEQKQYLKEKYDSLQLKIGDKNTQEFMDDLKQMGIITEKEAKCGEYEPSWIAENNVIIVGSNNTHAEDMDIRKSFHLYAMLQKGEAQKNAQFSSFFLNQSTIYEKLGNMMDYIFS